MRRRLGLLAVAVATAAALSVSGLLIADAVEGGASPGPAATPGSAKEVYLQTQVMARQQTADALPHAPKHAVTPPPRRASCPIDPAAYTSSMGVSTPPKFTVAPLAVLFDANVISEANGFSSDGHPYSVYLGSLKSDDQQGVIVSWRGAKDPCAEGVHSYAPQRFLEPVKGSPARFVRIEGDTVVFDNADGVQRTFNFVTAALVGASQPASTPAAAP